MYRNIKVQTISGISLGILGLKYPIGSATTGLKVGVAHFLEHLISQKQSSCHAQTFEAKTSRDSTLYWTIVEEENISIISSILDVMRNFSIDRFSMEKEKEIIIREIAQKKLDERYEILEQVQSSLFGEHDYANSIIGNEAEVNDISLQDLEDGMRYYECIPELYIIGPWEKKDLQSKIVNSFYDVNKDLNSSIHPPKFYSKGEVYIEGGLNNFLGVGWILPGYNTLNEQEVFILNNILKRRLKAITITKTLFFRMNIYEKAGLLTIDTAEYDLNRIALAIDIMKVPITERELLKARMDLNLFKMRSSEDLRLRFSKFNMLNLTENNMKLKEIRKLQCKLVGNLRIENGLVLSSENKNVNIHRKEIVNNDLDYQEKKHQNMEKEIIKSKDSREEVNVTLFQDSNRYCILSTSPLTRRFHVLIRYDCQSSTRLMTSYDVRNYMMDGMYIENIRYEGLDTIIHYAFSNIKNAIKFLLNHNSFIKIEQLNEVDLEKKFYNNVEKYIKWKMFRLINNIEEKEVGVCKGITIIAPSNIKQEDINRIKKIVPPLFQSDFKSEFLFESGDKQFIKGKLNGAGLIIKLPKKGIQSLALQEAAFGLGAPFPTLLSILRKNRVSYHFIQSLFLDDRQTYIYWASQCKEDRRVDFYKSIKEWLEQIYNYADEVEAWFQKYWIANNRSRYYSLHQMLRDTDRCMYYTGSFEFNSLSLREYVLEILEEPFNYITFEKEGANE
ncbi:insulinase family protein [Bacillus cereus group sp. BfR-BA-01380]|uniref:insulinase family protein n=1 Tax=Bacillus cereus group sp. BfR-BA-01380 TaxID=2920324 RepID=UPI001F56AD61|nr:insulinase family protein [Bacillus cereus group sp. BfR-BA-01380]